MIVGGLLMSESYGHSGRTDRSGGHNDNISGGYHYHGGNGGGSRESNSISGEAIAGAVLLVLLFAWIKYLSKSNEDHKEIIDPFTK